MVAAAARRMVKVNYALKHMYGYKSTDRVFNLERFSFDTKTYEKKYDELSLSVAIEFIYNRSSLEQVITYSILYWKAEFKDKYESMIPFKKDKEFDRSEGFFADVNELQILVKLEG